MVPINFLPSALQDFDESFNWYAGRSPVAAERFVNAIDAALERIGHNPHMFHPIDRVHQECSVKRFPFRIVFRLLVDQVLIVAIAHAKRRPNYWRHRK